MVLLSHQFSGSRRLVFITGLGLLGSALVSCLRGRGFSVMQQIHLCWSDFYKLEAQLVDFVRQGLDGYGGHIDFIWSAGSCGFASDEVATDLEMNNFKIWCKVISGIKALYSEKVVHVHMLSSAGGLFEGVYVTHKNQRPSPIRPYGILKQRQEDLLKLQFPSDYSIYRLSSVYGKRLPGVRNGLFTVLWRNSLEGRVTKINGLENTLRDYVFADDVVLFIADRIFYGKRNEDQMVFLVSGKPTSIYEVIVQVRKFQRGRLFLGFDPNPENRLNIVFSPAVKPVNWYPCEPDVGYLLAFTRESAIEK